MTCLKRSATRPMASSQLASTKRLFTFVAQPLFLIVGLLYLGRVFTELRAKDVL